MMPFLAALAEVIPAIGKVVEAVDGHTDKATQAAKVAADPKAPADVKAAAVDVASAHVDAAASQQKAALATVAGVSAPSGDGGGGSTTMLMVAAVVLLMMGRR